MADIEWLFQIRKDPAILAASGLLPLGRPYGADGKAADKQAIVYAHIAQQAIYGCAHMGAAHVNKFSSLNIPKCASGAS